MRPADDRFLREARSILASQTVPKPPAPPWDASGLYPIALDIDGDAAAISYAALDLEPRIARGWWCVVATWSRHVDAWRYFDMFNDNITSGHPFERPTASESKGRWMDWGSYSSGGLHAADDGGAGWHTHDGIAPVGTERITVTESRSSPS